MERKNIMKKFLSIIMVLVLVASLCVSAFAADNTGSITVTNATKDQTYTVYKIFDATIKLDANGDAEAVSYSIKSDNQFFAALFGADGKTENQFFNYEPATGAVTKKAAAVNSELINYLSDLVKNGNYTPAATPIKATSSTVKFDDLAYGYYMVLSTLGAAVTINSNTPDVEVIDKNQEPAPDFSKEVLLSGDKAENFVWGETNSAFIGDIVTYKISFTATNYDGANKVKYYQIHDTQGDAIWSNFETFKITVGEVELKKGYYLCHGDPAELNPKGLEYLGDWGSETKDRNNADWYLVQLSENEFRVTIPWLENHTISDVKDPTGNVISHSLNVDVNEASKFASPTEVDIVYQAVIEPDATIGGGSNSNLFNRASASWTSEHETGNSETDEVVTSVYGIGVLKDDGNTGINLAGAEFRIFSDADCTKPVYVIPTNIKGVYILDSLNVVSNQFTNADKKTSRELYKDYLEGYLGQDYATKQDNLVVSQVNGKLVVLGLEKGTYYLKEVKAPDGYNSLSLPVEIVAGEGTKAFTVFADANGNVADIQTEDGTHRENIYQLTSTVVHNSKGIELPSTGGHGTAALITIGTVMVIGFAVFLITHKKMSVYVD